MNSLYFILIGAVTGLLSGFMGIGGGIIVIPSLLYLLDGSLPPRELFLAVTATSLCSAFFATLSAARRHYLKRNFNFKAILPLGTGAFIGGIAGNYLSWVVPVKQLIFLIACFLMLSAIHLIKKSIPLVAVERKEVNNFWLFLLTGFLIGTFGGMTGLGGGVLYIPLLVIFFKQDIKKATGTTSFLMLFNTLPALIGRIAGDFQLKLPGFALNYGYLVMDFTVPIVLMAVLIAPWGVKLNQIIDQRLFQRIAGLIFFIISIKMLADFG